MTEEEIKKKLSIINAILMHWNNKVYTRFKVDGDTKTNNAMTKPGRPESCNGFAVMA